MPPNKTLRGDQTYVRECTGGMASGQEDLTVIWMDDMKPCPLTIHRRRNTPAMFSADGDFDSSLGVAASRPCNTLKCTLQRKNELKIEYHKRRGHRGRDTGSPSTAPEKPICTSFRLDRSNSRLLWPPELPKPELEKISIQIREVGTHAARLTCASS